MACNTMGVSVLLVVSLLVAFTAGQGVEDRYCYGTQYVSANNTHECTNGARMLHVEFIGQSISQCSAQANGWKAVTAAPPVRPSATVCDSPYCQADYDDDDWRTLNVPHDFVIEGTFNPIAVASHAYLPAGHAWYRLHFVLPPSAKEGLSSVWIQFDGVYRNSVTYLNGVPLGTHESGYTSFIYSLTESNATLKYGNEENVLAIFVDSSEFEGWWYEGGGIYRHVWLTVADKLHVKPWGVFAPSQITGIISNKGNGQFATEAIVYVNTDIVNYRATDEKFIVVTSVTDPNGGPVYTSNTTVTISSQDEFTVYQTIVVENVNLWSAESPSLYLTFKITYEVANGTVADRVLTTIGIRKVVFDVDNGLFVNDNPVKINGVCNHQDFAGVGVAVPEKVNLYRVLKLKEMGINGWRMSHNPPNPELLDMLDSIGMYVMNENRNFANNTQYFNDVELMVLRDRNHPSVIMWSVCNELGCIEDNGEGALVGAIFKTIIKNADPTRPVVAGMDQSWGIGLSLVLDLQGINYHYEMYPIYHQAHPYQPVFGSETASCLGTRGVYVTNDTACHLSIFNADECATEWVSALQTTPYVPAGFAWTGFDYKGEPYPYPWPDVNSNFGILDIAGFPKDQFYYYQSWFTNNTVLHLLPHWNWQDGDNVTIYVYTNAPLVDLRVNGISLGVQNVTIYQHPSWWVLWSPGTIEAIAYDANYNKLATHSRKTAGKPSSIKLVLDSSDYISADGQDVALVAVSIVDSNGLVVPTATNYVTFQVANGVVLGVGNGDPACIEPDKGTGRSAFGGLARVIVQTLLNQPGDITLVATSPGLTPAKLVIHTVDK